MLLQGITTKRREHGDFFDVETVGGRRKTQTAKVTWDTGSDSQVNEFTFKAALISVFIVTIGKCERAHLKGQKDSYHPPLQQLHKAF